MNELAKMSDAQTPKPEQMPLPEAVAPYYETQDSVSGNWWNRCITRRVRFSAEDYEEFSKKFQRMADELQIWQQEYKHKAKVLEVSIFAHPWILKRILQQFNAPFTPGHGYGDFSNKGTIRLHLHDAFDAKGTHYLLYQNGKKPQADKN
ncbi:hypothetical protein BKE30_11645 [Alkanindiges hydrocarboniclasticus]|uniref:Uncharacterized protein n=1 Tax=Alkanindiges hydrocarboniclasticus TaxID=1907941 RepID=A0A1S8CT02_9GAMM|nr:hypothetical protein [Alkanindiges hydrocarboniclasticus]ONG38593.1 hypothetical protein BKE30_11645 [Alkanindiges hydrocarboniclasticus]